MAEVADSHPMAYESDAEDTQLLRDQDIATLFAKYEPVIVGRCVARIRTLDAEDVAQNVMLRLFSEFRKGKSYRVPYRVVVHQVIGWTIADYFEGRPTDPPLPDDWEPADPGDEAGGIVSRYYLEELIAGLPEQTRRVIELRYLRGLEHEQIAGELGITRNNVDQRLHQGHKALRETLAHG
jgi:RNA polymerase sigma factor (sigma-70 family)